MIQILVRSFTALARGESVSFGLEEALLGLRRKGDSEEEGRCIVVVEVISRIKSHPITKDDKKDSFSRVVVWCGYIINLSAFVARRCHFLFRSVQQASIPEHYKTTNLSI
jgi:hypothetical protein